MVTVKGQSDEWDEDACLCQGTVPENKQMDFIKVVFDEKRDKWRKKVILRCHKDCPIHGIIVKE